MTEELIQRGLDKHGIKIGIYEFYNTSRTNLNTFKRFKIIPNKDHGKYGKREPDGLLVDRTERNNIRVIATLERKAPEQFRTDQQRKKAIQQCNDIAQVIGSHIGVITDSQTYIWINPNHPNKDMAYRDVTTGAKRSYSFIKNEDKKYLSEPFIITEKSQTDYNKLDEQTKNTLDYVERTLRCVNKKNSFLKSTEEVDPLKLAQAVWQDIYINTAKAPIKCLYNVVELFIFKFLSDLGVLQEPFDFNFVYTMSQEKSAKEALRYYATNSRERIREQFPEAKDKTTIINGTIFVDTGGKPVESQAHLFKNSLKKYSDFLSLRNVKKEFKTKLFETFLKQSSDKSRLGQFFTPRKVVRAVVDIADVEQLRCGARVCDPFCGVGGFISETIQKPARKRDFLPTNRRSIEPKITYHGFDKGSDDDDERIIILAKANLLIYLSDIIEKYPTFTKKFAKVFNDIFYYLTDSNLGTLNKIILKEEEKYDLILTNPPYITSGVTSIKNQIRNEGLDPYYTAGGKGVDGLALEWIIRSLKKGGKAFVIIRDGILNSVQNKGLKKLIRSACFINAIISLPVKTFFNTPQKTYILALTSKLIPTDEQDFPVFTYLVSDIGETLDVYRFETEGKSDLQRAVELFNVFKGCTDAFPLQEIGDTRCKLQPIRRFDPKANWDIDRWWSKEEKILLGIEQEEELLTLEEYKDRLTEMDLHIQECNSLLADLEKEFDSESTKKEELVPKLFTIQKGDAKYKKQYIRAHPGVFPVYSSQTTEDGVIGKIDTYDYHTECLTWTTDGIHAGTLFHRKGRFSMTTHCGALLLKPEYKNKVDLEYVYYYLRKKLKEYAVSVANKRLTVNLIKNVPIQIPVNFKGQPDIQKQQQISSRYKRIEQIKTELNESLVDISNVEIYFEP